MSLFRMVDSFWDGFLFLPRGASYLASNKRLWPYAAIPLVLNCVILAVLAVLAVIFFPAIRSLVWERPDAWHWLALWYGFTALLAVLVLLALLILFVLLLGIIAGPFNGKLSLRTRESLRGEKLKPAGGLYVDIFMPVINELKKLVLFILLQIAILFLNFLPVVGSMAYLVIGGGLSFLFLAYAFLEYAIETESWVLSLKQRIQYLRSRKWAALGFGAATSIIFLIPVLNLFLAPLAVVGAAMLYEHFEGQKGLPFSEE